MSSTKPLKFCVVCSRPAVRLRPAGWTCNTCWRLSAGVPKYVHLPVPEFNPCLSQPVWKPRKKPRVVIKIGEDRALVLRRCAEEPRSMRYLSSDTLLKRISVARKMVDRMIQRGLLRRIGEYNSGFYTTRLGLAYLAEFDAKPTTNTKESRP